MEAAECEHVFGLNQFVFLFGSICSVTRLACNLFTDHSYSGLSWTLTAECNHSSTSSVYTTDVQEQSCTSPGLHQRSTQKLEAVQSINSVNDSRVRLLGVTCVHEALSRQTCRLTDTAGELIPVLLFNIVPEAQTNTPVNTSMIYSCRIGPQDLRVGDTSLIMTLYPPHYHTTEHTEDQDQWLDCWL